jgi:O-antigen/teichoic acid export membrane protein
MIEVIKNIKDSVFFKHVSTLVGGTAIAQMISFGLYYFIAKIYTPADFGTFSLIVSFASIFAIIATGRFDVALMIPKNNSDVVKLYHTAIHCSIIFSSVLLLVLVVLKIASFFLTLSLIIIPNNYFIIPILIFAISFYQTATVFLSRQKEYKTIASSRIINTAANGISTLFFGFLKFGYLGLLIGFFLSYVASWSIVYQKTKHLFSDVKSIFNFKNNLNTAIEYKQFPMYNVPQALLDALQFNILIFVFNSFYKAEEVGQISFALRILQVPVSFIGASLAQVFFQQISEKIRNNQSFFSQVKRTVWISIGIFLPIWILFIFKGEWIFVFLFKSKWQQAGMIASILITWIFADFVRSPISQLVVLLNLQKKWLVLTSVVNIIVLSVLFASFYYFHEVKQVLFFTTIAATCCTIFLIFWILFISHRTTKLNAKE